MGTWLRLTLVTLTVGGGFAGVMNTMQAFSGASFLNSCLVALFLLIYGFITVAGLLFVKDARYVRPLMLALAIQIPWFSTPILVYRLAAGAHMTLGFTGNSGNLSLTANFLLGSTWDFAFGREDRVGMGVNLVALVLLIFLKNSIKNSVWPASPSFGSKDGVDSNVASNE